jgi:hypothetical protein
MWNDLVRVLNSKAQRYSEDREMAKMLLSQLNTAGASSMNGFTGEVENFVYRTKHIK